MAGRRTAARGAAAVAPLTISKHTALTVDHGPQGAACWPPSPLKEYPGAPHGLFATHKEQFNADLLDFIRT
jgi:pimeloyl-ACP methyl ester carboxylesterase